MTQPTPLELAAKPLEDYLEGGDPPEIGQIKAFQKLLIAETKRQKNVLQEYHQLIDEVITKINAL